MPFYNQHDDHSNFFLHTSGNPRSKFGIFAKRYSLAADRLAKTLLDAPRFNDYEAYPIVFLYRHALELYLKQFIYQSVMALVLREIEDVEGWLYRTHELMPLVHAADRLLDRLLPNDEGIKAVRASLLATCTEFTDIEPEPDRYRYPVDSKWNPPATKAGIVNLRSFHSHMAKVMEDCGTIDFGLNITVDNASEEFDVIQFVRQLIAEE